MFEMIVKKLEGAVWDFGIPVGDEVISILVLALLGTGFFLTLRLGFLQVRRLGHGFAVTSGRYDDPAEPGDVPHFQALTTALSATVGIGNIAGVALAIHLGGPGALFWMWVTAFLGMALKYSEVTLAHHFRQVEAPDPEHRHLWDSTVSGGPMYYIERGLAERWRFRPVAIFFKALAVFVACAITGVSFLGGNSVQAHTVADTLAGFGLPVWVTGLVTTAVVGLVILGGIRRIGAVTGVLAPLMATIYVLGALVILGLHYDQVIPTFALIFREAFHPTAGVAGTGVGALATTMMWGVRRGLFSNEAGQGSAPIAHAAAKTDEPVSEGVVALLEPFIDTLLICTMTGLVIITTGAWSARVPTEIDLDGGDLSWVVANAAGSWESADEPRDFEVRDGYPAAGGTQVGWHEVGVERLFVDPAQGRPFTGVVRPAAKVAVAGDGTEYDRLWGDAVENGAPLTRMAFQRGLSGLGGWGGLIVVLSVVLFAVSTAISWSYYGDRAARYLFGRKAVLPYKLLFLAAHFAGSITGLTAIWALGDVGMGLATFPNLIAVLLLSGVVAKLTRSYFERKPWIGKGVG
ncbi:MAG: sodium:alanine symporter family protein [bacterium]|nr:sodium:alanine symporter family protein [bacterium]